LGGNNKITIEVTLNPPFVIKNFELFTGDRDERVSAINKLKDAGYNVGITFAPLILRENWMDDYIELFKYIDDHLTEKAKENLKGPEFRNLAIACICYKNQLSQALILCI